MNIFNLIKVLLFVIISFYGTQIFAESVTVDLPAQSNNSAASNATQPQTGGVAQPQAGGTAQPQASGTAQPQAGGAGQPQASNTTQPQTGTSGSQQTNTTPASQNMQSDSAIATNIKASIATNNEVAKSNIEVNSKEGLVSLIGSVSTNNAASTLIEIAASQVGVKDIDVSKLMINTNQKIPSDSIITAKVKGILIREKISESKDIIKPIQVKSENGIVTLTGTVANQSQVDKIVNLVKSISGVHKVNSEIIIEEENNKK